MLGYQRVIKSMSEEEMKIWVYEKTPQKLIKHLGVADLTELPEWALVTSQNIPFEKRARVQATIQKYVDTAISSTFNLPAEATTKDIEDIYMTSWKYGLKGATVFRDKCKKMGILSDGGIALNVNPAPFPTIEVKEMWFNKFTGEIRKYSRVLEIKDTEYKVSKVEQLKEEEEDLFAKPWDCKTCNV